MSDLTVLTEQPTDPRDITHQVTRLARAIDRLPPGNYVIYLEKGDRLDSWRVLLEERQVIRKMELRR